MILNIVRSVLDRIRDGFAGACHDDRGIGVVEVILILVDICIFNRYVYYV